jgi:hypothetical protein
MGRLDRGLVLPLLGLVGLVGCAGLTPPPRQIFDTSPIAAAELSEPLRLSEGAEDDEDPALVRADDGTFHVVWAAKDAGGQVDLFVRSSRDGRSWSAPVRITDHPDADYYPALTQARDGTLHLTWFRLHPKAGRMDIWYAHSRDGRRWSRPIAITERDGIDWAPAIYEDTDRVLWILWSSDRTASRELFAVRSGDGGRSWSRAQQLTDSPEEDDFPHVLDVRGERVLVWTRFRAGSPLRSFHRDASAEVVRATSRDGLHWSEPVPCTPADPGNRYVEMLPFAFTDSAQDRVYVSWTSNRSHKSGDILMHEFAPAPAPIRQLTTSERSDYDAKIVPTGRTDEYLMVWVSTRDGKADIFVRLFRL